MEALCLLQGKTSFKCQSQPRLNLDGAHDFLFIAKSAPPTTKTVTEMPPSMARAKPKLAYFPSSNARLAGLPDRDFFLGEFVCCGLGKLLIPASAPMPGIFAPPRICFITF